MTTAQGKRVAEMTGTGDWLVEYAKMGTATRRVNPYLQASSGFSSAHWAAAGFQ